MLRVSTPCFSGPLWGQGPLHYFHISHCPLLPPVQDLSYLYLILLRGLFDPVSFSDSLQPLVELYLLVCFNEMSYWIYIYNRRPCFDWLKWHHTGISVAVTKKDVGENSEFDKWMSRKTDELLFSGFIFLLYILLSWTAALRNLFFLSPSPQEAFCKQHVLHS